MCIIVNPGRVAALHRPVRLWDARKRVRVPQAQAGALYGRIGVVEDVQGYCVAGEGYRDDAGSAIADVRELSKRVERPHVLY